MVIITSAIIVAAAAATTIIIIIVVVFAALFLLARSLAGRRDLAQVGADKKESKATPEWQSRLTGCELAPREERAR